MEEQIERTREPQELAQKPSKLPKCLATFIQKYIWIVALLLIIFPMVIGGGTDIGFITFITGGALLISGCLLLNFGVGAPGREVRNYILENDEYDLETPRKYLALSFNWYQFLCCRFKKRNALDEFQYKKGNLYLRTKDGNTFEALLWNTSFSYKIVKGKNGNDLFIFIIESNDNQKISFYKIPAMLEDEEWEDIYNILVRGNFIGESKSSKRLGKAIDIVNDTVSILRGDSISLSSIANDKITETIQKMTKLKILGRYEPLSNEEIKRIVKKEEYIISEDDNTEDTK